MLITCPICSDCFLPASCLAGCPCGHVFHIECLLQWLERSKSCPQCRKPTTFNKTYKLYLNISEDLSQEDPASLHQKLDDLKLNLLTKNSELRAALSEKERISEELKLSNAETRKHKENSKALESQVSALRKHARSQKGLEDDLKVLRQEKDIADSKLKTMRSMEVLMNGTLDEAESTLIANSDNSEASRTMVVFCSALKRQMNTMQERLNRSKREEERYKQVSIKETQLKDKATSELELLKVQFASLEREIQSLRNKLQKIESSVGPLDREQVKDQMLLRLLHESPMPEKYRNLKVQVVSPEVITITSPDTFPDKTNQDTSPQATVSKAQMSFLAEKDTSAKPRLPLTSKQNQTKPSCSTFRMLPYTSTSGAASAHLGKIGKSKSDGSLGVARATSSSLFGQTRVSRMASGGSLQKRLYEACKDLPEGMVYNGLGGTVRADQAIPSKKRTPH